MILHYIDNAANTMEVTKIKFGQSLLPIINNIRPNYIVIDKGEFEQSQMTEKQVILYFERLRKTLAVGGKIYLEVANYA